MTQRALILRDRAAQFRRLAATFKSPEMREHLMALARQCERIADEIDRSPEALPIQPSSAADPSASA